MLYGFTKNKHNQIWHNYDFHYKLQNITTFWLVWSYNTTQLPNQKYVMYIATRDNV